MSIKKNFVYSTTLTIVGYFFPLLTFPYVTRVLGVENIGICNFIGSVVDYALIFSTMGIATIGIREIAKATKNKDELNKIFSSLLSLNLLSTFVILLIFYIAVFFVPQLNVHKELLFIGSAKILSQALIIEWFFKGIEDFKYITIRSIIVRAIYVVLVFLLVKNQDDYFLYFALTTTTFVLNAIINTIYSRKWVSFRFKDINISPYVKPFFVLGVYQILTSMYTTFNTAYLGFVAGEVEVGYYSTAVKLYLMILAVFTAFTGVMLPRMSSLVAENRMDEVKILANKSVDFLLAFVTPLIILTVSFAPQIVRIIAGPGYEGAITPMRIVMPLMLIIGYEQIIIIQVLMPLKKDKAILLNSIWGCLTGFIFNIVLVSHLYSVGSAIVWIVSELIVMISAQYYVTKYIGLRFPAKKVVQRLAFMIPLVLICLYISQRIDNIFVSLIIGAMLVYIISAFFEIKILKNKILIDNIQNILKICKKRFL